MGAMEYPAALSFNASLLSVANEGSGTASDRSVQVGAEFQATDSNLHSPETLPEYIETVDLCQPLWSPSSHHLSDPEINEYLQGISKFGHFTEEQALAMLTFHNFDIKLATEDLKKYRPIDNKWCDNDRVAFENAFKLHGKNFSKLQEAVNHRSLADVISFYYRWKKQSIKTTVMTEYINQMTNKQDGYVSWWDSEDDEYLIALKRRRLDTDQPQTSSGVTKHDLLEFKPNHKNSMFDLKNNRHLTLNRKVTDLIVIDDDNEEDEKNSLDSKGSILNGQQSATTSSSGNVSTNSFASLPAHMSLSTKQLTKLVADAPNWTKIKDEMERRKIQLHQELQQLKRDTTEALTKFPNDKSHFRDSRLCKRLFETLQRQQKTPKWAPRETEFFLVSVRKLGISDLELLAGIMGTKTAQQIEQFLPEARIKFRLDDLLDKEKLERYASGLSCASSISSVGNSNVQLINSNLVNNATAEPSGINQQPSSAARHNTPPPPYDFSVRNRSSLTMNGYHTNGHSAKPPNSTNGFVRFSSINGMRNNLNHNQPSSQFASNGSRIINGTIMSSQVNGNGNTNYIAEPDDDIMEIFPTKS